MFPLYFSENFSLTVRRLIWTPTMLSNSGNLMNNRKKKKKPTSYSTLRCLFDHFQIHLIC